MQDIVKRVFRGFGSPPRVTIGDDQVYISLTKTWEKVDMMYEGMNKVSS